MDSPGIRNLGDIAITSALTDEVITSDTGDDGEPQAFVADLDGMLVATISANFNAGNGGGGSVKVDIDTSIDQGFTWTNIARIAFTTANAQKIINLSALTPKTTPVAPSQLGDDACLDGVLGDRLRARVTSTGTFGGNASLSVRLNAR